MDLKFPHHECEIAQNVGATGHEPVRYWMHGNMLTVNGRKMAKSEGNGFTPEELITGNHKLLEKGYSPMTVRFFILQTHYRSTLDFSNEALQASEKALRRLMDAYEWFMNFNSYSAELATDKALDEKVIKLVNEFNEFMNDDINTAKVIANMFELVPVINSIKDKHIAENALSRSTFDLLKKQMQAFIIDIFGLQTSKADNNDKLDGVLQLLINIRKEAKQRKDFVTSDKIRNELAQLGVQLKDEKDGGMSYTIQ